MPAGWKGAHSPMDATSDVGLRESDSPPGQVATRPFHVVFDVSDVINYFRSARLPTGIQRVQIEIIEYAIRDASFDFSIACFTKETNYWIEIPQELFAALCTLSVGEAAENAWTAFVARLENLISDPRPFRFAVGSILLNLGSSWWLPNYFLGVRDAKARYDVLYVPFVHDLIPIAMPELCVAELRNNFEEWIESVFDHADHFLVNSQNTLADLQKVAGAAETEREMAVVTLDADFRAAPTAGGQHVGGDPEMVLEDLGLERDGFVLFVSTIEPRKNHSMVFDSWLKLRRRHGAEKCPKLVCVGQRGWLNGEAHARLAASEELAEQIIILSNVSDAVLAVLYEACICTLYPSLYEGWGLPVTESLCFGKVPIVSRVASLLEAGGAYAEYFDVNSQRTFMRGVECLVFDTEYRLQRERAIRAEFRPRRWEDIGRQIIAQLRCWADRKPPAILSRSARDRVYPVAAETGVFYSLAGEVQGARGANAQRGEAFRNGSGWWWPEPWGCWIRERGPATLAFVLRDLGGARVSLYLGLRGVQGHDSTCTIRTSQRQRIVVPLRSEEEKIVPITLAPGPEQERQIRLTFTSSVAADFRVSTDGRDFRVCGVGVKWFYVLSADDLKERVDLIDTIMTEDAAWLGCKKEFRNRCTLDHDLGVPCPSSPPLIAAATDGSTAIISHPVLPAARLDRLQGAPLALGGA